MPVNLCMRRVLLARVVHNVLYCIACINCIHNTLFNTLFTLYTIMIAQDYSHLYIVVLTNQYNSKTVCS